MPGSEVGSALHIVLLPLSSPRMCWAIGSAVRCLWKGVGWVGWGKGGSSSPVIKSQSLSEPVLQTVGLAMFPAISSSPSGGTECLGWEVGIFLFPCARLDRLASVCPSPHTREALVNPLPLRAACLETAVLCAFQSGSPPHPSSLSGLTKTERRRPPGT